MSVEKDWRHNTLITSILTLKMFLNNNGYDNKMISLITKHS